MTAGQFISRGEYPGKKTHIVNFRCSEELWERLRAVGKHIGQSPNGCARELIDFALPEIEAAIRRRSERGDAK